VSDFTTARDAITNAVAGVTNIGQVYNHARFSANWPDFLNLFKVSIATTHLRGWWISRESMVVEHESFPNLDQHTMAFVIHGILSYKDGGNSDSTFADLLGSVKAAIDGLQIAGFWQAGPASVRLSQLRQFGSVICHYAEIDFPCIEDVAR
jgi:hypothetical protein